MTFMTSLQNFITETEADVVMVITDIKAGVAVVESDLTAAEHWIASNTPAIAAAVQEVLSLVETFGIGANPEVAVAVTAANAAVTALNAFAAASNTGSTPTQAVVAGYVAVQQANSAVSAAKAAAVSAPTTAAPTATAAVSLLSPAA
jgi:hypothetical protein